MTWTSNWSLGAAVLLVFMLCGGASLHATVPHDHGDGHAHNQSNEHGGETGGISITWQMLHSATRHEDKQYVIGTDVPMFPHILDVSLLSAGALAIVILILYEKPRLSASLEALRRGVVPYRRFG